MTIPSVLGLATCVPESKYSQTAIFEYLKPFLGKNRYAEAIFQKIGISSRHFVLDESYYVKGRSTQERNETYMQQAIPLGAKAIERCLDSAGVSPQEVTDFTVVSCTGLDIPGLDLRLAGLLGMRRGLHRVCVLGMGCYAALPALRQVRDAVVARPGSRALVLAVELCSLHFQLDDASVEQVVSTALFADGAAAILLGSEATTESPVEANPVGRNKPHLLDSATYCDYQTFEHMAFHLTDRGFRMSLSSYVPRLLSADIESFVDGLLARNNLSRPDIRFWMVHPGSLKILDYVHNRLGLPEHALDCSRAVLQQYGNMSSPTVLFVLNEVQQSGQPEIGDYGLMLAFGPGLTLEGSLVQW
jgi:alkylresorcinol/alkylpyrone synthase